jgi:hypothetical protein
MPIEFLQNFLKRGLTKYKKQVIKKDINVMAMEENMFRGTEIYNELLYNVPHYKKHSHMIPFIGKYWEKYKKLLVLGESHYLPEWSEPDTINNWYTLTTDDLDEEEISWTNTSKLIDNTWYEAKADTIFRNIDYAIIDSGFRPQYDEYDNSYSYIAYMNFFQRPANKTGGSINANSMDKTIANETLQKVVEIIKPDFLFFASSKSWDCLDKSIFKYLIDSNKIGHSCHPATSYWNTPVMKYSIDNKTPLSGKMNFINFIINNNIFGESK